MFTCNFNLSEPASLNTLEESKQTYLHIFSLQHEFYNICYWFFDVCRKCLQEKKKKENKQLYIRICSSGKSPYSAFIQRWAPSLASGLQWRKTSSLFRRRIWSKRGEAVTPCSSWQSAKYNPYFLSCWQPNEQVIDEAAPGKAVGKQKNSWIKIKRSKLGVMGFGQRNPDHLIHPLTFSWNNITLRKDINNWVLWKQQLK